MLQPKEAEGSFGIWGMPFSAFSFFWISSAMEGMDDVFSGGRMAMNSSPPRRPQAASFPAELRRMSAMWRRSLSPAIWP